jgi:two-component system nitrogen regulation sensor histidine kinase NtrY
MTSLRTRLTLAFIALAVFPVGLLGYFTQRLVLAETREAALSQRATYARTARAWIEAREAHGRRAVGHLCSDDLVIDGVLLALAAGPEGDLARMERLLPGLTRSLDFDTLTVLDARAGGSYGAVVSHVPPSRAGVAPGLLRVVEAAGAEAFLHEVDGGLALLHACTITRDGVRVAVVAGHHLDRLLRDVAPPPDSPLRAALHEGPVPLDLDLEAVSTFEGSGGRLPVALVVALDGVGLEATRRALLHQDLAVGGAALGLALLLSGLLTVAFTRPLAALEQAAKRVGEGDLASTLGGGHGGREVTRAFDAFNAMTRELERARARILRAERLAAWRDIAQRIAHEIKNPLSPIQVSIETMRKTKAKQHPDFDEIFEESTVTILEEVERLKRIVGEFSEFARLPRPRPAPVELRELLEHVARLLGGDEGADVEVDGTRVTLEGDREQLVQVLMNLTQNGLAAGRERRPDARVVLRVAPTGEGGAIIDVDDQGPGIPDELRVRIFEPYFTTRAEGTGLGLAIVHRIVTDHGGTIEVEDGPLGGARFRLRLPSTVPPEAAASTLGITATPRRPGA